jgi:flavin-dependent dehydrogenase
MATMQGAATERFDVLVIGGGPAGSTAATLLSRRGWRVLQVEKDVHPRFHIGESLLPANVPLFEQLGVLEKVRALGTLKLGADFPHPADGYRTFHFRDALGDTAPYTFQVKREDFDAMLFAHARENGVDARERVRVERVDFDAVPGGVRAILRDADGGESTVEARYLVDASGRDTFLGSALRLKQRNDRHQSAALFAHFSGVERRPGDDAGNISIYRFEHGWCWFIPLPDGLMSIGCVCSPDYLKQRRGRTTEFLLDTLRNIGPAWTRMAQAQIAGPTRVAGNYTYECSRMAGPRWVAIGDAYAFVDPIFSSGVFLAMHSASHAVEVVETALRQPRREAAAQRRFARRIQRGVRVFSWFIYRFNSPAMKQMFAQPSDIWQLRAAVISMLAGDVFDNMRVRRRLLLFKIAYAVAWLSTAAQSRRERRERLRQASEAVPTHLLDEQA